MNIIILPFIISHLIRTKSIFIFALDQSTIMEKLFLAAAFAFGLNANAQQGLTYQKPSQEILDLVDVNLAPSVLMDDKKENVILLYRNAYKSIADLSQKELRLGGLRIDPKTNIGSRTNYYYTAKIKRMTELSAQLTEINGIPEGAKLSNFVWSRDQSKIAFTNTTEQGVAVWVLNIKKAEVKRITGPSVNANLGDVINWFKDGNSLLVKMISRERKPLIDSKDAVPAGPTVSENNGKKAQNRTYQDLIKDPNDEFNFEHLALSEIVKVDLSGSVTEWLPSAMYKSVGFSPDGEYVMVSTVEKPFSYLVTYGRFPNKSMIYDKNAKEVQKLLEVPLIEDLPKGFMAVRTGKRSYRWRSDKPSTLVYAMALDGGDPAKEVKYRDEVFEVEAPFNGEGRSILKTINRFSYITWGTDNLAIGYDYWWNTRNTKMYQFDPSNNKVDPKILYDRNYQDQYSDPGSFETKLNQFAKSVLDVNNDKAYMIGNGHTAEGQFPFLNEFNFSNGKTSRLYTSKMEGKKEDLRSFDSEKRQLLVRIESASEYPNYYFRGLEKNKLDQITAFENPFMSIQNVKKEVINYKRDDGLDLSGTLYLPVGYQEGKKYPMILWAYPREFKDKSSAAQNTQNPNKFTYPYYGSPVYWVTKGYVVLDNATFPIVGEGEEQPNDSFRKQLVANAKAAIDAVDKLGHIDRNKVAVGGHSYGAFMVANLLSHSDLFAAGIARSGAYNRTLTPFGFQSEERNYWESPDVYNTMSPFMHADKMKTPLLLIHGEADNNSGTYPMQSERYFNALKGLGATVRLVILPKESHGYRAKESILHLLWEQDQWLDKYVKNKE